MTRLILDSLSPFVRLLRLHDSGDFFSQTYFDVWLEVARRRADATFYWYTKAIPFWVARLDQVGDGHTPGALTNIVPTASWGGTHDRLITEYGLRSAEVVLSELEGRLLGLEVDHDDSHAMRHGPNFALLIHGTQPAGSEAARAVQALKKGGWTGYGRKRALEVVS